MSSVVEIGPGKVIMKMVGVPVVKKPQNICKAVVMEKRLVPATNNPSGITALLRQKQIQIINGREKASQESPALGQRLIQTIKVQEQEEVNINPGSLSDLNIISLGKQLLDSCKKGDVVSVKMLINSGAPFIADWVGTSPLHFSVMNKHVEVTEILLKAGICRDAKNKVDRTPLHIAASMNLSYMVKILLCFGAEVNCKDLMDMTPLHWAAEKGDSLTAKILIDYGADIGARNKFNMTPYETAFRKANTDVLKTIEAAQKLHPELIKSKVMAMKQKVVGSSRAMKPVAEILEPTDGLDSTEKAKVVMFAKEDTVEGGEVRGALFIGKAESQAKKNGDAGDKMSKDSAIDLLKSHGVTMIEPDSGTVIDNAILSGHTIRLTDAGKLAFKSLDRNPKKLVEPVSNEQIAVTANTQATKDDNSAADKDRILSDPPLDPEKGALYLQRLSKRAVECRRHVDLLKKQLKIKEQELLEVTKQIDMFKSLCTSK